MVQAKLTEFTEPNPMDVLCGRSHTAFHHPGNRDLRIKIASTLNDYNMCPTRHGKTVIIRETIKFVQDRGGRFLKYHKDHDKWYDGGAEAAKIRVSTAFRDARIPNKVKCMEALSRREGELEDTKLSKPDQTAVVSQPKVFSSRRQTAKQSELFEPLDIDRRSSMSIFASYVNSNDFRSSKIISSASNELDRISSSSATEISAEPDRLTSANCFPQPLPSSLKTRNMKKRKSPRSSLSPITPNLLPSNDLSAVEEDNDEEASVSSSVLDGIDTIDYDFDTPLPL